MAAINSSIPEMLAEKGVENWTIEDVSSWLTVLDLAELSPMFVQNDISGSELVDLSEKDLVDLGVTRIGHKKRIMKAILNLRGGTSIGASDSGSVTSAAKTVSEKDETESVGSAASAVIPSELRCKVTLGNEMRSLVFHNVDSLDDFRRRITAEYKADFILKYEDADKDQVNITTDMDLALASKGGVLRLFLQPLSFLPPAKEAIYNEMLDGVFVIDKVGHIQFMNNAVERMFGWSRAEAMNKNIRIMMPESVGRKHKKYLKNYLTTGVPKVIGRGRTVVAQRKNGQPFSIRLTVTDKTEDGKRMFIGICHEIERGENSSDSDTETLDAKASALKATQSAAASAQLSASIGTEFSLLESVLDPSLVIDDRGKIFFANKAASQHFGFSNAELLSKNVRMLMPEPFRSEHDDYLSNYRRAKVAKIIGIGREVPTQLKDGSVVSKFLKVTSRQIGGREFFIGMFSEAVNRGPAKSVLDSEREVANALLVPSLIIDEKGTIQAFNKACSDLFGYSLADVIGKNVKMLMTEDDAVNHDSYLENYRKSGVKTIIGKGRAVVIRRKDSSEALVKLYVTEKKDDKKKFFVGLFQS